MKERGEVLDAVVMARRPEAVWWRAELSVLLSQMQSSECCLICRVLSMRTEP